MEAALERLVWERAESCCEYCLMPQIYDRLPFQVDHIIAIKHRGLTEAGNLALACFFCNNRKGPNISGIDPKTGKMAALFHPRRQRWKRHFGWDEATIAGKTSVSRATIDVLELNLTVRVELRQALRRDGLFPPQI